MTGIMFIGHETNNNQAMLCRTR